MKSGTVKSMIDRAGGATKSRLKHAIAVHKESADLKWRQPPAMKVVAGSGAPAVYYLAPDNQRPSGGIKVIYHHVDALNKMGVRAAVVHRQDGFRCTWFENTTQVISASDIRLHADDVLVVPECYGPTVHLLPPDLRKVVFNQGAHHTFDNVRLKETTPGAPYSALPNLVGFLTVSTDGAELLDLAFPDVSIGVARNVIDPKVFRPRTQAGARRVAYVPTRRTEELHQLLHILRARGIGPTGDWELVEIAGNTEAEVGDILRSSSIFMSLSDRDGFGLPPAEAMATGCYVVGYPGGGGREFFDPDHCTSVQDSTGLVRGLLDAIDMRPETRDDLGLKASARILGYYNEAGLSKDLEAFYGMLL